MLRLYCLAHLHADSVRSLKPADHINHQQLRSEADEEAPKIQMKWEKDV